MKWPPQCHGLRSPASRDARRSWLGSREPHEILARADPQRLPLRCEETDDDSYCPSIRMSPDAFLEPGPDCRLASAEDFAKYPFQVELLLAHIFNLLRAAGLAFNCDCACVADAMQLGEHLPKVDQPFADEHLFTQFAGIGGPSAVLGMHAAEVRPQNVHRVHRVGLAVENQIGRVQPDSKVGQANIVNHPRYGRRCLLAGLHQEILPVALAVLRDRADGFNRSSVERVAGVLWNEAAMRLHLADAQQFGEIRSLAKSVNAGGAGFRRNQADGGGPAQKVPDRKS